MSERTLKPGWSWVKFGDVIKLNTDRCADPVAEGIERYVGLEHIEPEDLRIRRWGFVAEGTTFTNRFKPGQVLFGKRRAYLRKVAVADFEGICSSDIYVFEPKNDRLLPELLSFLCQTESFFEHAIGTSAGSLSPRTNWTQLADYEFALPSLEIQQRICNTLCAAINYINVLKDALEKQKLLIQSLLNSEIAHYSEQEVSIEYLVTEGIIAPPQDGNHGEKHPKARDYVPQGIPFLMASDIKNGQVDLHTCKFISESLARTLRIGFARTGDVLLTHKGTVGETALLNNVTSEFVMLTPQVTYYRVNNCERLIPEFLYYVFKSSQFQGQLWSHSRQSVMAP